MAASTLTRELVLPGGAQLSIAGTTKSWAYPGIQGHTVTTGNGTLALRATAADDGGRNGERTGWHQAGLKLAENAGIRPRQRRVRTTM